MEKSFVCSRRLGGTPENESETRRVHFLEGLTEFLQRPRLQIERHADLDARAEIERLEGVAGNVVWMSVTEIVDSAAEGGAEIGNGEVVPDVNRAQPLCQPWPVQRGQRPLREVVREPFGEKVVLLQALERVIEN